MDELPKRLTELTEEECHQILEEIRWKGIPTCPYCDSQKSRKLKNEQRYQCNECFTSYSVTVGTIFHKTRIALKQWFYAVFMILGNKPKMSIRKLAKILNVNKNTSLFIRSRVCFADQMNQQLLAKILKYIID